MAAAALRRSAKTTPNRKSTQSWPSNSDQATEDGSRNPALVLDSEQQQSSASMLTLPPTTESASWHTDAVSHFTGSATEWFGSVPAFWEQPGAAYSECPGSVQPAGNNETLVARDDLNSDIIVNAQLTHLVSRDDALQGQDAPHFSDVPMPDAPSVHDIATPRRMVDGRCCKWCISAQLASGKRSSCTLWNTIHTG